jgi:hypothetical protein
MIKITISAILICLLVNLCLATAQIFQDNCVQDNFWWSKLVEKAQPLFSIISTGQKKLENNEFIASSNEACLDGLRKSLSPGGFSVLTSMLMNSGKSINQLGDPDMCKDDPTTEYVIIKVIGVPIPMMFGTCVPNAWNSKESFGTLLNFIEAKVLESGIKGMKFEATFPYQSTHKPGTGFWITVFSLIFIWILGAIGIAVELLPIFEKTHWLMTSRIEERKTNVGLFFYSFSFKNNIEKLFTVSDRGDANLRILNGIRVLSICWVIVGHGATNLAAAPATNMQSALQLVHKWYFPIIPGGYFAVDVFFFLSGFLTFFMLTSKMYQKMAELTFLWCTSTGGSDSSPLHCFEFWRLFLFSNISEMAHCITILWTELAKTPGGAACSSSIISTPGEQKICVSGGFGIWQMISSFS